GACLAQTSESPQAAASPGTSAPTAAPANQLPAGTIIPAELAKSIDAKKAKSGDQVIAKTTIDLRSKDGSTVIPKGAKVLGNAPADSGVPASGGVGPLSPASQGVVGIQGLSLQDSAQASVITSSSGNVHLDSGTQLILRAK